MVFLDRNMTIQEKNHLKTLRSFYHCQIDLKIYLYCCQLKKLAILKIHAEIDLKTPLFVDKNLNDFDKMDKFSEKVAQCRGFQVISPVSATARSVSGNGRRSWPG